MSVTPETPSGSAFSRRSLLQRAAVAGVVATPAVGLLAACAGGTTSSTKSNTTAKSADNPFGVADKTTVDVVVFDGGLGHEYPVFDKSLFNQKHPTVTVNLDNTQKIKTQEQPKFSTTPSDLINNSGADLMALDTLVNSGALTELTPLLDAATWDDPNTKIRDTLLPGTVNDGTLSGGFYALNYAYTVFGMWYNQALFDKQGWTPPTSFDEFFALVPKIKAAGIAPYAFAGKYPYYSRWGLMTWIWKAGGKQTVLDIDNLKPNAWMADGVTQAVAQLEKLVKDGDTLSGSATLSHTQSQQAFLDGKAAFLPCGTWLENEMKATIPAGFKLTMQNYWNVNPSADKADGAVYAASGENWIVPKKAANAAGGMEFLRAMLSKAGSAKFADLTHSLTSTKGSGDTVQGSTALTSSNAVMKGAQELVSFQYPTWYADLDTASQNALGELMAGRSTGAQFQSTVQKAFDKVAADSSVKKQTHS